MSKMMDELRPYLARFGRRLRLRDGWLLAQAWVWVAWLGAALIQLAGRVWPVERLWFWTLAPLIAWPLGVVVISLLRSQPAMQVARRVDAELGLKERLATALTFGGEVHTDEPSIGQASLITLQREDALAIAQAVDLGRAFPLRWLRGHLWLALALAAATVILALLPNPMDVVLDEKVAVSQAAKEQAGQIEALREEVERAQDLTSETREELLRQLAELAELLRTNLGDREEALADLSQVEETLRQRLDPNAAARQANIETLAAQLQALTRSEAGQESAASDVAEALEGLAEELGEMDVAEREELAKSLAQMAVQTAQAGDGDLAQALASLAQAAQSGDGEAALQAAQDAAVAAAGTQNQLADQVVLQQTLSQLRAGRQAISQAGQGQSLVQNQGQGQPGGGGGTKADTLPPFVGVGKASRPQGEGEPASVGELDQQQIYVPWERQAGSGEMFIPSQDTDQGEIVVREQKDLLPGTSSQALIPYHEVYYEYLDAAHQTMERSYIPSGLKDYVRAYFSQLEP
jgi:hypothetical protein